MLQRDTITTRFCKQSLPPPRAFYEREFEKLGREHGCWVQVKCPFHGGRSMSSLGLNLQSGGFHCFSCGISGGDVLQFARLRYHLDFVNAAKMLGAWNENGRAPTPSEVKEIKRQQERRRRDEERRLFEERRRRVDKRDSLHLLQRIYSKANRRLSELQRGAAERFENEKESCWGILADLLPQIRSAENEYAQLAGLR